MTDFIKEATVMKYYEKVAFVSIDKEIRDACVEVANKVADEIIAEYDIKNLILKQIPDRKKMMIALQVEKRIKK